MANKKSIIPESEEEKLNVVYRLTVRIAEELEQARIAEYTQLLHRPFRLIMLNLLSGAARGVGVAIGFTFLPLQLYMCCRCWERSIFRLSETILPISSGSSSGSLS